MHRLHEERQQVLSSSVFSNYRLEGKMRRLVMKNGVCALDIWYPYFSTYHVTQKTQLDKVMPTELCYYIISGAGD